MSFSALEISFIVSMGGWPPWGYFTFSVICTRHTVSPHEWSCRIILVHIFCFLLSILEKDVFLFTKDCDPLRRLSSVKLFNLWPQGFENSMGTISQFVSLFFALSHALCKMFATKIWIFQSNQATNCPKNVAWGSQLLLEGNGRGRFCCTQTPTPNFKPHALPPLQDKTYQQCA